MAAWLLPSGRRVWIDGRSESPAGQRELLAAPYSVRLRGPTAGRFER